jgi:hypothetical protein
MKDNIFTKTLNTVASVFKSSPPPVTIFRNGKQFFYEMFGQGYSYNRRPLSQALEDGMNSNPVVFGAINKIAFASNALKLLPYRSGKPIKGKTFDFDLRNGLINLISTGTLIIYESEIVGFGEYEYRIIDTLNIVEQYNKGKFEYWEIVDGKYIKLNDDNLIFITIYKIPNLITQLGLSPLQVAGMPLESMREMYTADTYLLKNKGADGILTNDSDMLSPGVTQEEFDEELNGRIAGAKNTGRIATSTAKLKFVPMGRTAKELALWDGYKIKVRDLANALFVDSSIFNDPDNKKFSNVSEGQKALYTECVIPLVSLICMNKDLKRRLGYEIFLDTSNVECLQQSQKERFEKNNIITDVIIKLNEKVVSGSITREIAVKILNQEWNYDIEEAEEVIVK